LVLLSGAQHRAGGSDLVSDSAEGAEGAKGLGVLVLEVLEVLMLEVLVREVP
jgi:hypothetical protein